MISIINPAWLFAAIPAFAVLLALYLRKGKSIRKKVSSLFFIKQLPSFSPSSRKKLFLPARAILELILISLLLLTIAGLSLKDTSEKLTIIVDNSLSMQARAEPRNPESMLDVAKREAASNLNYFSSSSKVSVWITSPKAYNLTQGFVSQAEALDKINSIKPAYASENIEQALNSSSGRTLVFSDFKPDPLQSNQQIKLADLGIVKSAKENIAIESARLDPVSSKIILNIRSFINSPVQCQLKSARHSSGWIDFSNQKISLSGNLELAVNLPADFNQQEALRLEISGCSRPEANSLLADDRIWLSSQRSSGSFNFISSFDPKSLKLNEISNFSFKLITPERWEESPDLNSPAIFHRYLPKNLPAVSSIFVYPPASADWLPSETFEGSAKLIDWDRSNPVLRYLNFPALSLSKVRVFSNPPAWSSAFLKSSAGDVAIIGNNASRSYAALGFEIFPFAGKQNLPVSILTLNLLDHIANSQNPSGAMSFSFQNEITNAEAVDSGLAADLLVSADKKRLSVEAPGLYRVQLADKAIYQAAQQFIESESNLLSEKTLSLTNLQNTDDSKQEQKLDSWLILGIALLVTADLLMLLYRRKVNA